MTKWVHTQHITEHNTYWKNREHYRRGKTFYSLFLSKWFSCSQNTCFRGKRELWSEWKGIVTCLPLEHVCKLAAGLRCHLRAQNGLQLPPLAHRWEEGLKATANWLRELLGNCREVTAIRQDQIKFKVHWRILKSDVVLLLTQNWSLEEGKLLEQLETPEHTLVWWWTRYFAESPHH